MRRSDGARCRVAPELIGAYRRAHYHVPGSAPPFALMIDVPSAALAECQRAHGVARSALLTAWNPGSRPMPAAANAAAAARLEAELKARGYVLLAASGVDPSGIWEAEEGVLALGIGRSEACAVGRAFGQAGLVFAGRDAVPRLVLLD